MFAKRERGLLLILGGVVVVLALAVSFSLGAERLRTARTKAAQYQAQISRLQQSVQSEAEIASFRDRLKAELEKTKTRFYAPGEIDPYSFGLLIKKKLVSRGMTVVRYQVVEIKGESSLEFSVSGSISSLITFLKEVSESDRYWTISSLTLTMREGTGAVDAVFRIGYEVIGS